MDSTKVSCTFIKHKNCQTYDDELLFAWHVGQITVSVFNFCQNQAKLLFLFVQKQEWIKGWGADENTFVLLLLLLLLLYSQTKGKSFLDKKVSSFSFLNLKMKEMLRHMNEHNNNNSNNNAKKKKKNRLSSAKSTHSQAKLQVKLSLLFEINTLRITHNICEIEPGQRKETFFEWLFLLMSTLVTTRAE